MGQPLKLEDYITLPLRRTGTQLIEDALTAYNPPAPQERIFAKICETQQVLDGLAR